MDRMYVHELLYGLDRMLHAAVVWVWTVAPLAHMPPSFWTLVWTIAAPDQCPYVDNGDCGSLNKLFNSPVELNKREAFIQLSRSTFNSETASVGSTQKRHLWLQRKRHLWLHQHLQLRNSICGLLSVFDTQRRQERLTPGCSDLVAN